MGTLTAYIKHTPVGGSTTTIYDFESITVRRQMEAKTTSAKIVLPNKFGKYSGDSANSLKGFSEDDQIQIYANWEAVTEADHLLLNMTIKEFSHDLDEGKQFITITGMDRTYQLLNKLFLGGFFKDGDSKSADEAIKDIINWVSTQDERTADITTTNVATTPTKKDSDPAGTAAFKNVALALSGKTAYEWIQALSETPYTDYTIGGSGTYKSDRPYIFWVDADMDLHWVYPGQSPVSGGTFDIAKGSLNMIKTRLKKSVFDVVNMVIFDGGGDPNGDEIRWYYYDVTSKQPELRMKFIPMRHVARDLQAFEKTLTTFSGEFPSAYPYTTSWNETVNNDSEYTGNLIGGANKTGTGFRGEVRRRCENIASSITQRSGDLRWSGFIDMRGTHDFVVGDLLKITYNEIDMTDQLLRVIGVDHTLNNKGWITRLNLKEDSKTIVTDLDG